MLDALLAFLSGLFDTLATAIWKIVKWGAVFIILLFAISIGSTIILINLLN